MLTKTVKNTIDLSVPAILAGAVAYMLLKAGKGWQFVLIASGIAFLVAYIVTSQVTKAAYLAGPAAKPGGNANYDPKELIDGIYTDCTCTFCFRQKTLYTTLLGLTDAQLISAYNYWNANYYSQANNQSLPVIIAAQSNTIDSQFEQDQTSLANRFATLGLQ